MLKQKRKLLQNSFWMKLNYLFILFLYLFSFQVSLADSLSEKREELEAIQKKIYEVNKNLKSTQNQANSLAIELANFDAQIQETQNKITATQGQITETENQINEKILDIQRKEDEIKYQERILNQCLQELYEQDNSSTLEILVVYDSFSDFLDQVSYLGHLEKDAQLIIQKVQAAKAEVEEEKRALESKKKELENLKADLENQKTALDLQRAERQKLFEQTKGQESLYQQQLAAARAQEAAIFSEIIRLESKNGGNNFYQGDKDGRYYGYFISPLDHYRITQGYGMTSYAASGAYGGQGHNGIDIVWYHGAPVRAAASGMVILGTHRAWGNWVAVVHANGLVTLYAHLAGFAVSYGQYVSQGQVIGYQGNTGASTGSHLHFSVYWSFWTYTSAYGFGPAYNYSGTLNPLSVLP